LKGVVVSGKVLTCGFLDCEVNIWVQPLSAGRCVELERVSFSPEPPLRWSAGRGALWINDSFPGGEFQRRYELQDLLRGRLVLGPGAKPIESWGTNYFAISEAIGDARFIGQSSDFDAVVHYDHLPSARDALLLFVLTNVGGRGKSGGGGGSVVVRRYPRKGELRWSFTCYSVRARWNKEEKRWDSREERDECSIDVDFREPFQALSRGEDYYFLTASGKLYRAPRPAKGKHRKLQTIWDDKRSPITAHITDADKNRTFLFCDSGPKGKGGPCVFELASGVRLRHYDKALFRPGDQGPDSLRRVLGYGRVLQTLGYIKDDQSPAQTKKDGKQTDRGGP
jgi:hypothetical protein